MISRLSFSLTQLEYVLAVHKLGHFAKAADACSVTQPTLSMQIQKLEEDLGIIIFDRSKKPILVTDLGRKVIEQIQKIVFEARKVSMIVEANQKETVDGELVVAVIPTIAPYLLPLLLPQLEAKWSGLKLRIFEMQTKRILQALENDEIDVGILATPLNEPKFFEIPLYYEPFLVLCGADHELAQYKRVRHNLLKADDIWLLEEGHCLRHQVLDVCSIRKAKSQGRQFEFESGSLETLKNLVDRFGGYTLVPELASKQFGEKSKLIRFERPIPSREIGLIYQREHYKSSLIEALGDAILDSLPEALGKLRKKDLDVLAIEKN